MSRGVAGSRRQAGRTLKDAGYVFDVAYTSVLKRAIKTLWLALDRSIRCGSRFHHAGASTSGTTARCRG